MTVLLSPILNTQFFLSDGTPAAGAKLFTYVAGTTTKVSVYTDNTGGTAWANPITLDSGGNLPNGGVIWVTSGTDIKAVLAPSNDTDPPVSPYWTKDNLPGINDSSSSQSEWIAGPTATYLGSTQFTLAGDQTATFAVNRRLKAIVTAGTIYGTITASAYTTLTTVTVLWDSGSLDSGLSTVYYSFNTVTHPAVPSSAASFLPSGTGAKATDLQTLLRFLFKTPQAFGAIADGVSHPLSERYATLAAAQVDYPHAVALTDQIDWAACQALINDQFAGSGGIGFFPDAHYMLNRSLDFDNAQGWSLITQSWYGVIIEQMTDNTQIFKFTGAATHYYSFLIDGFYGQWTNDQSSANTDAVMIQFNENSGANINYDSFRINRIHCHNGYRMISTKSSGAYETNVWGFDIDNLNQGSSCSGATVWIKSNVATGMPNARFGTVYINCAQANEDNFFLQDLGMFNIENLEFNSLTKTGLHLSHCVQWNILCIRHESCPITDTSLTLIENGGGTIHQYHAESCTLPNGATFLGGATASNYAPLIVHAFGESSTSITGGTGTLYVADGVGAYPIIFTAWPIVKSSNILRWNMTTGAGVIDYVRVLEALSPFHSYGNLADTDVTLAPYTDAVCQTVPTLTADRAITLSKVDAFNGLAFIIQRISASPGAFTLTIKNSAGTTILTMPASEKHVAEFIWSRQNDWTVRSYTPAL